MAIKLIMDSSCDLPKELIQKYDITILPLSVNFGQQQYRDGVDITTKEFYQLLEKSSENPKTSQVSPAQFIDAFEQALANQQEVVCITIGSKASGTYQSANIALEEVDASQISLIDSNGLCMGTGYLGVLAGEMIQAGHTRLEIEERILGLTGNRIEHLFSVDTMEYLKRGGRVRATKALMAQVLNIKPILNVADAITQPIGKVRGRKRIIPYFIEHIKKTMDYDNTPFLSVIHSESEEFAEEFIETFKQAFDWKKPIYISELGATIGTHTGSGVLACFYIKKD